MPFSCPFWSEWWCPFQLRNWEDGCPRASHLAIWLLIGRCFFIFHYSYSRTCVIWANNIHNLGVPFTSCQEVRCMETCPHLVSLSADCCSCRLRDWQDVRWLSYCPSWSPASVSSSSSSRYQWGSWLCSMPVLPCPCPSVEWKRALQLSLTR